MAKQKAPQRSSKPKPGASSRAGTAVAKKPTTIPKGKAAPVAAKPAPAKGPVKPTARQAPPSLKKPVKPAAPAASKPAPGKPVAPSKAPLKAPVGKPAVKGAPAAPAKPVAGKPVPGKPAAPGKPGSKAPPVKPVSGKPVAPKAPPPKKKPDAPPPPPPASMADMRAAASRLAAAAGLHPVRSAVKADAAAGSKVRKPAKTPLTREDLDHYRSILVQKRSEIAGDVSTLETEALSGGSGSLSHLPQHMADQGSDVYDQTLSLDLAASQRKLLIEIDQALERIAGGTYGVCSVLGIPIGKQRLDAKPWAKTSIEAARMAERGALPA